MIYYLLGVAVPDIAYCWEIEAFVGLHIAPTSPFIAFGVRFPGELQFYMAKGCGRLPGIWWSNSILIIF